MPKNPLAETFKVEKRILELEAESNYHLIRFGDHIAKKRGYKKHKGLEALRFYLVEKYHWLPSQVKALSFEDLRFLFAEEMHGWTLPKDAQV